jgi:5-methylcytosine-specific restriction endonuclease McrA
VEILSGKHAKTCSRACSNKLRIGLTYKQTGRPLKDKVVAHKALRIRVIEKYGNSCVRCSYPKTHLLVTHHIIEKAKGGSDDLDNLELLCSNCHVEEHYNRKNNLEE